MQVAVVTRKAKLRRVIGPTVLPGDDTVDVEGGKGHVCLKDIAVLAVVAGALTNKATERLVHQV
jgi:hypothetical protein